MPSYLLTVGTLLLVAIGIGAVVHVAQPSRESEGTGNGYQLAVSFALLIAAWVSASLYFTQPSTEGKIALPDDASDALEPELDGEKDPFDVTQPEDVVDGTPLDEHAFWAKIKLWKIVTFGLLILLVSVLGISLGWALAAGDVPSRDCWALFLRLVFEVYLAVLAFQWIGQDIVDTHWPTTIHLSALSGWAALLLGTTVVLPTTPLRISWVTASYPAGLQTLWYISFAISVLVMVIAINVPRGPKLHFPSERIYSSKTVSMTTTHVPDNVCGLVYASVWDVLLFSYTTKVVLLGYTSESLEIGDLPVVPADMRATYIYAKARSAIRHIKFPEVPERFKPSPGSGWRLLYQLMRLNATVLTTQLCLAAIVAVLFYTPAFFLQRLVAFLEGDPDRKDKSWGWFFCIGLFVSHSICYLVTGQLWSLSTACIQVRLRVQLNSILFAKTLIRKDVASSSGSGTSSTNTRAPSPVAGGSGDASPTSPDTEAEKKKEEEGDFSTKQQIMNLMTVDMDRVSSLGWYIFTVVDSPIEIVIGTFFLYKLIGVSCFIGLAVTCIFLPLNHYASKFVVEVQDNLMKARDERVALMNEVLGGIRMLKFMAWERSFEKRVLEIREKELKFQKRNYIIETVFNAIWGASPLLVTLVSFWHYTVYRGIPLTPSVAFTSIAVFGEMRFALNALPETFISILQSLVSARRIEKYLNLAEVAPVPPLSEQPTNIALNSATITWPQERSGSASASPSAASTPRRKFILMDLNIHFPPGELSLICGKLGSGKTLLLHALLGEADILAGQLISPRSPPDCIATFTEDVPPEEEWIVPGITAYVPQVAWLQNASIRDNILFHLPYDDKRYKETLDVCALVADLKIFEDGDLSEIGERGVNLSGGQKARVSLARAVYSRASILLLDDVLSAVDAHTADHLFEKCIKGPIMRGRTVILVSHHVQLCTNGAKYVVALDNGRVLYAGDRDGFVDSGVMTGLVQSGHAPPAAKEEPEASSTGESSQPQETISKLLAQTQDDAASGAASDTSETLAPASEAEPPAEKKTPRKFIEEEQRAVGRIGTAVWKWYITACGGHIYWPIFAFSMILAAASPVFENGWLKIWSGAIEHGNQRTPEYYISIYSIITFIGLVFSTLRWFVLYYGSIEASKVLYKKLLETVLFARIRFHDTISRGRLLNRFGKDFEGIDSNLADNFGRSVVNALSVITTFFAVSYVGGIPFFLGAAALGVFYYNVAKVYGQTSRDMRRLDSVTRSPLYSIYGETISGVTVIRSFGASSKFLRDMLRCVDTNTNPYYWMWGVNRWLAARFNLLSSAIVGVTALTMLLTPRIDASLAGFALAFVSTVTGDLLFLVRRFVALEQSMVAVERVKEYSELEKEPPEFVEPRPPPSWPLEGAIECENLVIRYAPDLPDVLHNLTFSIEPGEKVGVLGRTGSGKSTLALSFFRFVEPTEGRIVIDGVDISKIGLTDLRSRMTIIPQDPTILSGTLRSTLDVFGEYDDAQIYEALRRVHLISSEEDAVEETTTVNVNVFKNLDSSVSEGGENFSAGEKQLICMARAILKRSKVLFMDEATASVDYATDELISKTIRTEFADSTIVTIAHRLRTVVDYNRVLLLEQGRIMEFDRPAALLADPTSRFYSLCRATGEKEFEVLKRMAGVSS